MADLHLDRPLPLPPGLDDDKQDWLRKAPLRALEKAVTAAVKKQVDFVLISGDIYHKADRSVHAFWAFRNQMVRLSDAAIPVYMIHGNHDPVSAGTNYFKLPANVHVFPPEGEAVWHWTKTGGGWIYGFSYPEPAYTETPYHHYIKQHGGDFHIALLHGQAGSDTSHAPYAPFQPSELRQLQMDYWALGHIHQRQLLMEDPPIVYPGSLTGLTRKETGEKGVYEVRMPSSGRPDLYFLPCADVLQHTVVTSIQHLYHMDEWIQSVKRALPETEAHILLTVQVKGSGRLHQLFRQQREETAAVLESELHSFSCTLMRLDVQTASSTRDTNSPVVQDILDLSGREETRKELDQRLEGLHMHGSIRRHAAFPDEQTKEELLKQAADELLLTLEEEVE
ncbi:DNA repair exonuclease [Alkalicoccus chagannorensis]